MQQGMSPPPTLPTRCTPITEESAVVLYLTPHRMWLMIYEYYRDLNKNRVLGRVIIYRIIIRNHQNSVGNYLGPYITDCVKTWGILTVVLQLPKPGCCGCSAVAVQVPTV